MGTLGGCSFSQCGVYFSCSVRGCGSKRARWIFLRVSRHRYREEFPDKVLFLWFCFLLLWYSWYFLSSNSSPDSESTYPFSPTTSCPNHLIWRIDVVFNVQPARQYCGKRKLRQKTGLNLPITVTSKNITHLGIVSYKNEWKKCIDSLSIFVHIKSVALACTKPYYFNVVDDSGFVTLRSISCPISFIYTVKCNVMQQTKFALLLRQWNSFFYVFGFPWFWFEEILSGQCYVWKYTNKRLNLPKFGYYSLLSSFSSCVLIVDTGCLFKFWIASTSSYAVSLIVIVYCSAF